MTKQQKAHMTQIEKESNKLWAPKTVTEHGRDWLEVMTKFGPYQYRFNDDMIFGRFTNIELMNSLIPPREQIGSDGNVYQFAYYPNVYSGKFNFITFQCDDFIDTLSPLIFGAAEYDLNGVKIL